MAVCKECMKKRAKANYDPVASSTYYQANKDRHIEQAKKWRAENGDRVKKHRRDWYRKKYHTDPAFRTERICRARISQALNGNNKSASTIELLGCTIEHARFHIESQFKEGMTWDNIHIDHIQPCASFDLEDPNEQRKCFHYTNLQPLLAEDNLRKSDSIVPEHQVKLL